MINPIFFKSIATPNSHISFRQKIETSQSDTKVNTLGYIESTNKIVLDDLNTAYDSIMEILHKKTSSGIKSIVNEAKNFNTADGLTFKNVDNENNSISFEKITKKQFNKYTKILVKDSSNNIKEGFLVKDNNFIVKNFDIKYPNKLPETPELYTKAELEELKINDKLKNILSKLDQSMLQARLFVNTRKDKDLKPPTATIPSETGIKLNNIKELCSSTNETCKDIPAASLTRLKNEYGDYAVQLGQSAHKLKNITDEKLQIVYSEFNNAYNGSFQRIMVYNADNSLKTGYLFKYNKIVSNFNPEYPSFLPDRIDFVNVEEMKNTHYNEELNSYIDGYSEKINDYKEFIIEQRRTPAGSLKSHDAQKMKDLDNLYKQIEETLKKVSINTINKVKNAYSDYDIEAGKKGLSFLNVGQDNLKMNIFKSKAKGEDEVMKLTMSNADDSDEVSLTIKNNTKFVLNYNTPDSVMQEKLKILNHLDDIQQKLNDFKAHSDSYVENIPKGKIKKQQYSQTRTTKHYVQRTTIKKSNTSKTKTSATKENTFTKEKEYNELINESVKQFKTALKEMKGNVDVFDEQTAKIRQNIVDFIESKKKAIDQC